jgi:excisionase family DNA binding protein
MAKRSFLTTFEISQICEVNPTTVQNWVREKKLKAYVTPGGHRRIRREDLVAFMKQFGMPLPAELIDRGPHVLIVDDEPEVLKMLSDAFQARNEGVKVAMALGGVEALLLIGERKPDLLILDILMPGMNGIEVCRKLKEKPGTQNIKIVAITGQADPDLKDRILQAGADLFYKKPLNVIQFCQECLKLLKA